MELWIEVQHRSPKNYNWKHFGKKTKLPLCVRVLTRRVGGPESMSERPRAPLFTAKPDDVSLRSLCSWVATTAPPTIQCPVGVITPVTKHCGRRCTYSCWVLRFFLCWTIHHKCSSKWKKGQFSIFGTWFSRKLNTHTHILKLLDSECLIIKYGGEGIIQSVT